jgi:hypothetical protein
MGKKIAVGIFLLFCLYVFMMWYSPYDADKTIGGLCAKAEIGEKEESFLSKLDQKELSILKKIGTELRAQQYAPPVFSAAFCTISVEDGIIVGKKFLTAE